MNVCTVKTFSYCFLITLQICVSRNGHKTLWETTNHCSQFFSRRYYMLIIAREWNFLFCVIFWHPGEVINTENTSVWLRWILKVYALSYTPSNSYEWVWAQDFTFLCHNSTYDSQMRNTGRKDSDILTEQGSVISLTTDAYLVHWFNSTGTWLIRPYFLALLLELTFYFYIRLSEIMRRCEGGNRWLEHSDGKKNQRSLIRMHKVV